MIVLTRRVGALWTAVVGGLTVAAAVGSSWFAFIHYSMLINPVYTAATALVIYLTCSLLGYLRTEGERRHVRRAFSQYLAPAIVEQLSRNPKLLKLGGELRELTVMFSDIRDFTKISEKLDPQALTHLINSILTPLTDAIYRRKGTVDKYIGDCIMAFWNAPLSDAEHGRNSLLAALGMREALAEANRRLAEEAAKAGHAFSPVGVGIGINSGPCSVGNMGSQQRFAYSALGDTVNLASRLESLTRAYGVEIIVGEDAAAGIDGHGAAGDRPGPGQGPVPAAHHLYPPRAPRGTPPSSSSPRPRPASSPPIAGRTGRRPRRCWRIASWPPRRWGRWRRSSPPASPNTRRNRPIPTGTASIPPPPRPAETAFSLASRAREMRKEGECCPRRLSRNPPSHGLPRATGD